MYFYKDGFIGVKRFIQDPKFLLVDEPIQFEELKKTKPIDWVYRNKEITYNLNEYGHRSKSISQLEKDYVLFVGCSHTFGYGLALEDTYAYKVAKRLNLDYYNLSITGGQVESCFYNTLSFLNKVENKPKKIFIQWPQFHRVLFYHNDNVVNLYSTHCNPETSHFSDIRYDPIVYNTLLKYNVPESQSIFRRKFLLQYINDQNLEYYELSVANNESDDLNTEKTIKLTAYWSEMVDRARDDQHAGIETNNIWTDKIINQTQYTLLNNHTLLHLIKRKYGQ